MSHYAVLVLHKENQDIDEMLAPYNENLEVEPYLEYTKEQAIERMKEIFNFEYTTEEAFREEAEDWFGSKLDEKGDVYSTYNPKSKWDWYQIGGRFNGMLTLINSDLKPNYGYATDDFSSNENNGVNSAFVRHVKWYTPLTEKEKQDIIKWWNINVENQPGEKDEYFFYKPEWFKQRYKNVETYIKIQETLTFRSVVTPDGEWYEPGKMGWWGCSLSSPEDDLEWDLHFKERFIDPIDDFDLVATVVDCHI